MKKLQRYRCDGNYTDGPCNNGEWVEYKDAAEIERRNEELEQRNEKLEVMVKELEKYLLDRNWEVYKLRAKMRSMEQVAKFRIENLTVLGD